MNGRIRIGNRVYEGQGVAILLLIVFFTTLVLFMFAIGACVNEVFAEEAEPPVAKPPIVIVHGFSNDLGSESEWLHYYGTLETRFKNDGYTVHRVYLTSNNLYTAATEVCQYLINNNLWDVALVGHSQGGPVARYCIKFLGQERASFYASIDSPETGLSSYDCFFFRIAGGSNQLCSGSDFIKALNSGDPTPGDIYYMSMTLEWRGLPGSCFKDIPGSWSLANHEKAPARADVYAWIKQGIESRNVCGEVTVPVVTPTVTNTPAVSPTATATPSPTPTVGPTTVPAATATPRASCSALFRLFRLC